MFWIFTFLIILSLAFYYYLNFCLTFRLLSKTNFYFFAFYQNIRQSFRTYNLQFKLHALITFWFRVVFFLFLWGVLLGVKFLLTLDYFLYPAHEHALYYYVETVGWGNRMAAFLRGYAELPYLLDFKSWDWGLTELYRALISIFPSSSVGPWIGFFLIFSIFPNPAFIRQLSTAIFTNWFLNFVFLFITRYIIASLFLWVLLTTSFWYILLEWLDAALGFQVFPYFSITSFWKFVLSWGSFNDSFLIFSQILNSFFLFKTVLIACFISLLGVSFYFFTQVLITLKVKSLNLNVQVLLFNLSLLFFFLAGLLCFIFLLFYYHPYIKNSFLQDFYLFFDKMLYIDFFTVFFWVLNMFFLSVFFLILSFSTVHFSLEFLFLFFCLLLFSFFFTISSNLLLIGLGLDSAALLIYILINFYRPFRKGSVTVQAVLKYFLFNTASFLLYYLGCVFLFLGGHLTLNIWEIGLNLVTSATTTLGLNAFFLLGLCFVLIALFIKLGAAPFYYWMPDIYASVPLWWLAFLGIFYKNFIFYLLFRFYLSWNAYLGSFFNFYFMFIGCCSLLVGVVGALYQRRLSRFYAFSAIAQTGYILLAFSQGSITGYTFGLLYLFNYTLSASLFFLGLTFLKEGPSRELWQSTFFLSDLARSRATFFSISLFIFAILSLSGFPPLLGFFSKFYILFALLQSNLFLLCFIILICTLVSFYYYFNILKFFFFFPEQPSKTFPVYNFPGYIVSLFQKVSTAFINVIYNVHFYLVISVARIFLFWGECKNSFNSSLMVFNLQFFRKYMVTVKYLEFFIKKWGMCLVFLFLFNVCLTFLFWKFFMDTFYFGAILDEGSCFYWFLTTDLYSSGSLTFLIFIEDFFLNLESTLCHWGTPSLTLSFFYFGAQFLFGIFGGYLLQKIIFLPQLCNCPFFNKYYEFRSYFYFKVFWKYGLSLIYISLLCLTVLNFDVILEQLISLLFTKDLKDTEVPFDLFTSMRFHTWTANPFIPPSLDEPVHVGPNQANRTDIVESYWSTKPLDVYLPELKGFI